MKKAWARIGRDKQVFLGVIAWAYLSIMNPECARAEIQIHGFGDIVASQSNTDFSLNGIGNRGRTVGFDEESRMGLNLSSALSDQLDFASQILARGAGGGYYNLQADWLFLTYRPTDQFALRVGRQILPVFLLSEQTDVGYTYLWARLPYQVYGTFPIKSFNGLSGIYSKFFGTAQFSAQALFGGGELVLPALGPTGAPNTITAAANAMRGITLKLIADKLKFQLHYSATNHSKVYFSQLSPAATDMKFLQIFTAGASYDSTRIMAIAEGLRCLGNGGPLDSSTSGYLSLGYHLNQVLTPYLTGAWRDSISSTTSAHPSVLVPTPSTLLTSSYGLTGGLNFRAGLSTVLKAEFMRTGLRFVDNSLNYRVNTITSSVDFVF
ncbi:MAG: hypothetical protein ACXWQO_04140 [Bdellovibrionota bacterium]